MVHLFAAQTGETRYCFLRQDERSPGQGIKISKDNTILVRSSVGAFGLGAFSMHVLVCAMARHGLWSLPPELCVEQFVLLIVYMVPSGMEGFRSSFGLLLGTQWFDCFFL